MLKKLFPVVFLFCSTTGFSQFSINDFSSAKDDIMRYDDAEIIGSSLRLRMEALMFRRGSTHHKDPQHVLGRFSTTFTFQLTGQDSGFGGGDNLRFCISPETVNNWSANTSGWYDFDAITLNIQTFQVPSIKDLTLNDRANGMDEELGESDVGWDLDDGLTHTCRIEYRDPGIYVYCDGSSSPQLSLPSIDISLTSAWRDNPANLALVGFDSWGGNASENVDVQTWDFESDDDDLDDDGLLNDDEIAIYGTNPDLFDTDGDGLGDGQELGVTNADITVDTSQSVFIEDSDPASVTDPLNADTDGGGLNDGNEDLDGDGAFSFYEFDPNDSTDDLFHIQASPLVAGSQATITLSGHRAGSTIAVVYSLSGTGETATRLGFNLGIAAPFYILPYQVEFTSSSSQFATVPPMAPSGLPVWMQAVEKLPFGDFFRLTTVLATQIQ